MERPVPPLSIPELEKELGERTRNLYPMDASIPRAQWPQEVERILSLEKLPDEYAASPVWTQAHYIFWQIRVFRMEPNAVMWNSDR